MAIKPSLKLALKLVLTGLIVGILVNVVGWTNLLKAMRETQWNWVAAMLGAVLLARLIDAVQMHLVLRNVQARVRIVRILLANALSTVYAFVFPGDVLAGAAKWLNLSGAVGNKSLVLNAIAYNRIALIIPPLVAGTVSLAWENPFDHEYVATTMVAFAFLAMAIWLALFHREFGPLVDQVWRSSSRRLPAAIRNGAELVMRSLKAFRALRLRDHSAIYALSVLGLGPRVATLLFAMWALSVSVSVITVTWLLAVLLVARWVPITISNLGVREGILIVVLGLYDVEPERALAVGLIVFSGQVFVALFGLAYQVALTLGLAKWQTTKAS